MPILLIVVIFILQITGGAERLRRRREAPFFGGLVVAGALRSSALMGGLYKRTHSEALGEAQAQRGAYNYYTLRVFFLLICMIISQSMPFEDKKVM